MNKEKRFTEWNYIYQAVLLVLFIIRIIGLILSVVDFSRNYYKYSYDNPGKAMPAYFVILFAFAVIIRIIWLIYNKKVIDDLKVLSNKTIADLIKYYILKTISWFVFLLPYELWVSIIASFAITLLSLPFFVYYYKRRELIEVPDGFDESVENELSRHNNEHRIKIENEAIKMLNMWGSELEKASHEEKALFLASYYILERYEKNIENSAVFCKFACVEYNIASSVIIEKKSNCDIEDKIILILKEYYNSPEISMNYLHGRMMLYQNIYQNQGVDPLIDEVLLVISNDVINNRLVEEDVISQSALNKIKDKNSFVMEVNNTIIELIDLIDSELKKK